MIENTKNIICHFKLNGKNISHLESCQLKILNLFQIIIEFENKEIHNNKLLTTAYFNLLHMHIPSSLVSIKSMIDKCIEMMDQSYIDSLRISVVIQQ